MTIQNKPSECPKCHSQKVVRIEYGLIFDVPDDAEDFVMGGCCVEDDSPQWACRDCHYQFNSPFQPSDIPPIDDL